MILILACELPEALNKTSIGEFQSGMILTEYRIKDGIIIMDSVFWAHIHLEVVSMHILHVLSIILYIKLAGGLDSTRTIKALR